MVFSFRYGGRGPLLSEQRIELSYLSILDGEYAGKLLTLKESFGAIEERWDTGERRRGLFIVYLEVASRGGLKFLNNGHKGQ